MMPSGSPRLRLYTRSRRESAPLTLSPAAVAIRDNLAERCHQYAALSPDGLDLAAAVLAALHEALVGRETELRGVHSPEYRRRQLLGRDGLPVESLAYLARLAPEAVKAGLEVLARAIGCELRPLEPDAQNIGTTMANTARAFGDLGATFAGAVADGRLSEREAQEIDAALHHLKHEVSRLEASVHDLALGGGR